MVLERTRIFKKTKIYLKKKLQQTQGHRVRPGALHHEGQEGAQEAEEESVAEAHVAECGNGPDLGSSLSWNIYTGIYNII